jgi:hypothetical protein
MLMCDRILQMSNSQTTNSEMYRTISRIRMVNFSGSQSLVLQILQSRKQHRTLVDRCSKTTKADVTASTHETLVGHLLIIAVGG